VPKAATVDVPELEILRAPTLAAAMALAGFVD
jgi:hypothetical protein